MLELQLKQGKPRRTEAALTLDRARQLALAGAAGSQAGNGNERNGAIMIRPLSITAGIVAALGIAACGSGVAPGHAGGSLQTQTPPLPCGQAYGQAPCATQPAPVASPNGTYQGACDYTLGNDPVDGTAVATGDIETTNTGNIGEVIQLTLTWPQQGYSPLTQTKSVSLKPGAEQDVQFNMPLTETQISNLQNWQSGHDGTGCTYAGNLTSTFGSQG
jgi:hypothetical protein